MEFFPLVMFAVFAGIGIAAILSAFLRRTREKPSDFAAGVARSLSDDAQSWDYDQNENWIISHKAYLEISLQMGNFGRVNTRQCANTGSTQIVTFEGADRRAFANALAVWREKTAIDRAQIAERRKRDALQAMAA